MTAPAVRHEKTGRNGRFGGAHPGFVKFAGSGSDGVTWKLEVVGHAGHPVKSHMGRLARVAVTRLR